MSVSTSKHPEGQVLVIVALSVIALIALVALAVDGGNLYSERRAMQNAADAGALAGAGEYCYGSPANAEDEAIHYATVLNNADGDATVATLNGHIVTVTATKTVENFFARAIGFNSADVTAVASAACGRITSGSALWPIAFPMDLWLTELYRAGEGCEHGVEFEVWENGTICSDLGCSGSGESGWLDFSGSFVAGMEDNCDQPGQAAKELICRLKEDNSGMLEIPSCITRKSGMAVTSALIHGASTRVGHTVRVPVYDGFCGSPPKQDYHVVAVACIRVTEVKSTGNPKYIKAVIDCTGCEVPFGSTDGAPAQEWEARAVSLIQ